MQKNAPSLCEYKYRDPKTSVFLRCFTIVGLGILFPKSDFPVFFNAKFWAYKHLETNSRNYGK